MACIKLAGSFIASEWLRLDIGTPDLPLLRRQCEIIAARLECEAGHGPEETYVTLVRLMAADVSVVLQQQSCPGR